MQLFSPCYADKLTAGRRVGRSLVSGLLPVCKAWHLIRPPRVGVLDVARSNNGHNAPQPISTGVHHQLVPQNGTSSGINLPAAPESNGGPAKVNVRFEVPEYLTHWGQVLKVVGSLDELGNWKVEKAPIMEWHEGHSWTLDVQLPVGAVNFKVVMQEPHGGVRWEEGADRSVMIPETTSVTGAPVGEVDVTCNFNDVHNSRVDVRPDRNYLKQQLKAVEARVMAIQEKKRKLDKRMSMLTEGIKKYDHTVALLEGGVQDAVTQRQHSKDQATAQQQQTEQQRQPSVAATASHQQGSSRGGIMVPILSPEELPSWDDLSVTSLGSVTDVETAEDIAAFTTPSSSSSDGMAPSDEEAAAATESVVPAPSKSGVLAGGMNAIKASHVNETVLSATVDQLLAAAEDALARSGSNSSTASEAAASASSANMENNGVNSSQLAEEYVEELLAAASALEQQADQRASLLLEAAKQTGNDGMVADIEKLTTVPMPGMPTPEQLAEAAAAEAAAAMQTMAAADDSSSTAAVEGVTLTLGDDGKLQAEAAVTITAPETAEPAAAAVAPAQSAVARTDDDGTITFTAESLNAEVSAQELLAAVMKRIGIPLAAMGQVTITATFTPATPGPDHQQQPEEKEESTSQQQMQHQPEYAEVEQQQQVQGQERQLITSKPVEQLVNPDQSTADALGAAIGAAAAAASSQDGDDDNSSGGGDGNMMRSSRGSSKWGGNGSNGGNGRYSKIADHTFRNRGASATSAAGADLGIGVHAKYLDLAQEAEKQLATKEAARRAAAEKVAAALAQVEEMRQSVITSNSLLADQLRSSSGDHSWTPAASAVPSGSSRSSSAGFDSWLSSEQAAGSSGNYSRYRVNYKDGDDVAAAPTSVSSAGGGGAGAASAGSSKTRAVDGPRSMPTVAAAAVAPQRQPRQRGRGSSVDDAMKEELLALAAIAASVQSTVDVEHGYQEQPSSRDEF